MTVLSRFGPLFECFVQGLIAVRCGQWLELQVFTFLRLQVTTFARLRRFLREQLRQLNKLCLAIRWSASAAGTAFEATASNFASSQRPGGWLGLEINRLIQEGLEYPWSHLADGKILIQVRGFTSRSPEVFL
jgi:hypothetical protein